MPLDLDNYLSFIRNQPDMAWVYLALAKVRTNLNQLATNVGSDSEALPPPPQIASLSVKSSGTGLVHSVISDPASITRNLRYFLEYSTNQSFNGSHVVDMGASRSHIM